MPRSFSACCTAFTLALALPAGALADSGSATGGTAAPQAQNEQQSQGGDMAVDAPRSALVGDRVRVRGTARRARSRVVRIESRAAGGPWTTVVRVRADRKGVFSAVWRPRRAGAYELRARASAASSSGAAGGTAVPVEVDAGGSGSASSLTVYEPSIATWYGPGFFGKRTACGVELTETTVGVAHRELPCGTQVRIVYQGRSIVVGVIDRGPFANNADWDLTQAAAQQLGMTGTSRIGALPLAPDR